MIRALYTSATGMKAQQLVVDNTANNLANVNTTGFKRSQVQFQDLLYVTERAAGLQAGNNVQVPSGLQIGSGVRPAATTKIFTQGVLEPTGRDLDVAIAGDGFLQVILPNGQLRYTRDGALLTDATGQLVNSEGYLIQPALTIPANSKSIFISPTGAVSVLPPGDEATPILVGELTLVRFVNPTGLSSEGGNLYAETAASGPPQTGLAGDNGFGILRQNFLERSNVEVVSELVSLILAQRAYEINSRAIRAGDEMLSTTNNLTR